MEFKNPYICWIHTSIPHVTHSIYAWCIMAWTLKYKELYHMCIRSWYFLSIYVSWRVLIIMWTLHFVIFTEYNCPYSLYTPQGRVLYRVFYAACTYLPSHISLVWTSPSASRVFSLKFPDSFFIHLRRRRKKHIIQGIHTWIILVTLKRQNITFLKK